MFSGTITIHIQKLPNKGFVGSKRLPPASNLCAHKRLKGDLTAYVKASISTVPMP